MNLLYPGQALEEHCLKSPITVQIICLRFYKCHSLSCFMYEEFTWNACTAWGTTESMFSWSRAALREWGRLRGERQQADVTIIQAAKHASVWINMPELKVIWLWTAFFIIYEKEWLYSIRIKNQHTRIHSHRAPSHKTLTDLLSSESHGLKTDHTVCHSRTSRSLLNSASCIYIAQYFF